MEALRVPGNVGYNGPDAAVVPSPTPRGLQEETKPWGCLAFTLREQTGNGRWTVGPTGTKPAGWKWPVTLRGDHTRAACGRTPARREGARNRGAGVGREAGERVVEGLAGGGWSAIRRPPLLWAILPVTSCPSREGPWRSTEGTIRSSTGERPPLAWLPRSDGDPIAARGSSSPSTLLAPSIQVTWGEGGVL